MAVTSLDMEVRQGVLRIIENFGCLSFVGCWLKDVSCIDRMHSSAKHFFHLNSLFVDVSPLDRP